MLTKNYGNITGAGYWHYGGATPFPLRNRWIKTRSGPLGDFP